jgi:chemotaxis protein CheZ
VSDLAEGADALDQLDERVKRLSASLAELGWDSALRQLLDQIPDARERLRYVAQMTEDAANKVLNIVDATLPACQAAARDERRMADDLTALLAAPDSSPEALRTALGEAVAQLRRSHGLSSGLADTMTSIMLAQDFQDLSGQVIKKVVTIIDHTEEQLGRMVHDAVDPVEAAPAELSGPQVPTKAVAQADVDDLLASLGF